MLTRLGCPARDVLLLIIAMIFRPEGLWPHRSVERSPRKGGRGPTDADREVPA